MVATWLMPFSNIAAAYEPASTRGRARFAERRECGRELKPSDRGRSRCDGARGHRGQGEHGEREREPRDLVAGAEGLRPAATEPGLVAEHARPQRAAPAQPAREPARCGV